MVTRSNSSRERILGTAESIVLQKGFAGTSIEDIVDQAAITKGGFFYHFQGKTELAQGLVERYLVADDVIFDQLFSQADELSEDPLHQLLIFLKLFAKMMEDMDTTHPGCLIAGFTYESQQFNDSIRDLIKQGVLSWRNMIAKRLAVIVEQHPPRAEVDIEALADMFTATIEGAIILSRIFGDNKVLRDQILCYRKHLRLLFDNT